MADARCPTEGGHPPGEVYVDAAREFAQRNGWLDQAMFDADAFSEDTWFRAAVESAYRAGAADLDAARSALQRVRELADGWKTARPNRRVGRSLRWAGHQLDRAIDPSTEDEFAEFDVTEAEFDAMAGSEGDQG